MTDKKIWEDYLWTATEKYYAPYKPPLDMLINSKIYFVPDQARRLSEIKTDLDTYVKNSLAEFVTGVRDPNNDKQWQDYINELKALGYEEYIEIFQARIDLMK